MDEQKIRNIVRQELQKQNNSSQYNLGVSQRHTHNGLDSLQIKQDNVIPSVSVSGRITFAQETNYTINLNSSFTPSHISLYGIAYDANGSTGVRCIIIGSANLGPSFYLQPGATSTSVVTGDIQYPFVNPEGNIVDVQWSGTIYARATITSFSKTSVVFNVSTLASDWEIYTNIVIT